MIFNCICVGLANAVTYVSDLNITDKNVVKTNFRGIISFDQPTDFNNVTISVKITGLNPSSSYGLHIHQACNPTSCTSFNAHFNPQSKTHGKWNAAVRHVGDLMMCDTDQNGNCFYSYVDPMMRLSGTNAPQIDKQGVVLHSAVDDFGLTSNVNSPLTGNSGTRIACGCLMKGALTLICGLLLSGFIML